MIKLGKYNFLVLCLLLFNSLSIFPNAKLPLIVKTHTLEKKEKNCTYKIQYPVLKIARDAKYDRVHIRQIRRILVDNFTKLEKYENDFECNKKDKNAPAFSLNGSFIVKYQSESILSIYSSFSSYTVGNAHPENVYKTYNFNLFTGGQVSFQSLFKKDGNFLIPLHKAMADTLLEEKNISEREEFISAKKNRYDFYLSEDGIHFINLFDIHAMQSIEAKIPYDKIKKYLDTENTLKFLK